MKLKIPPPIIAFTFAFIMWGISTINDSMLIESSLLLPAAIFVFLVGISIALSGIYALKKASTTLNPMKVNDASQLVSHGIYQFTRNPMYLGLLFALSAMAIWFGNILNIFVLPFFVLYITNFQIVPEEKALAKIFEESFEAYKSKVRRWI